MPTRSSPAGGAARCSSEGSEKTKAPLSSLSDADAAVVQRGDPFGPAAARVAVLQPADQGEGLVLDAAGGEQLQRD